MNTILHMHRSVVNGWLQETVVIGFRLIMNAAWDISEDPLFVFLVVITRSSFLSVAVSSPSGVSTLT